MQRDAMETFVIFDKPDDYPNHVVVRQQNVLAGAIVCVDPPVAVVKTLKEARAAIPRGKIRILRDDDDPPAIVEVWL